MMMSSGEEETEIFTMHDKSPPSAVTLAAAAAASGANATIKSLSKRRSRQRVDAGEPRNSYASIPNFSSRPPQTSPLALSVANNNNNPSSHLYNGYASNKMLNDLTGRAIISEPEMMVIADGHMLESDNKMNGDDGLYRMAHYHRRGHGGGAQIERAHLLRDMLQQANVARKSGQNNMMTTTMCSSTGRPSRTPSPATSAEENANSMTEDGDQEAGNDDDDDDEEEEEEDVTNECNQMAPNSVPVSGSISNGNRSLLLVPPSVQPQLMIDELSSRSDSCAGRNSGGGASRCNKPESTRPESCQNSFDSRDVNKLLRNMGDDVASGDSQVQHPVATTPNRHMINGGSSPTHALPTPSPEPSGSPIGTLSDSQLIDRASPERSTDSPVQQKRARVEHIVTNMLVSNYPQQSQSQPQVNGCKKRKQYQPQQHDTVNARMSNCDSDEDEEYDQEWPRIKHRKTDKESLKGQLKWMQEQLSVMQEKYNTLLTNASGGGDTGSETDGRGTTTASTNEGNASDDSNSKATPDVTEDEEEKEDQEVSKSKDNKGNAMSSNQYQQGVHPNEGLIDPSLFIDEARRLVSEQQEKLAKENESLVNGSKEQLSPGQAQRKVERNINSSRLTPPNFNIQAQAQQTANAAALLSNVVEFIKLELSNSLPRIVDTIVASFVSHQPRSVLLQAQKIISETSPVASKEFLSSLDRKSPRTKVSDRGRNCSTLHTPITTTVSLTSNKDNASFMNRSSPFSDRSIPVKPSPAVFPTIAKMPTAPLNIMFGGGLPTSSHPSPNLPPFSQSTTTGTNNTSSNNNQSSVLPENSPEQTEAMSLVVSAKKKRTKVTDTRPSSRSIRSFDSDSPSGGVGKFLFPFSSGAESSPSAFHPASLTPIVPNTLPTSVAIPNPSLHQSDIFTAAAFPFDHSGHPRLGSNQDSGRCFRDDSDIVRTATSQHHLTSLQQHLLLAPHSTPTDVQSLRSFQAHHVKGEINGRDSDVSNDLHNSSHISSCDVISPYDNGNLALSSTLTPMHLRKAKLMFFYVRYPSSAVLKTFFPDIKFNKNNTAQLVKWFSNFREFYYIQMEKYARQALSEGVKNADDLTVSLDSEIYRILNLHYNRNNHIEVPPNFRYIVEQSLREFFRAVLAGKDSEQSWKKAIYKVIARLDDNVPEYFKSPNFLEQLE